MAEGHHIGLQTSQLKHCQNLLKQPLVWTNGADESGQDHGEPEELEELPGGRDVGQVVDGGGAQEGVDLSQHVGRLKK